MFACQINHKVQNIKQTTVLKDSIVHLGLDLVTGDAKDMMGLKIFKAVLKVWSEDLKTKICCYLSALSSTLHQSLPLGSYKKLQMH